MSDLTTSRAKLAPDCIYVDAVSVQSRLICTTIDNHFRKPLTYPSIYPLDLLNYSNVSVFAKNFDRLTKKKPDV